MKKRMKKIVAMLTVTALSMGLLVGCGDSAATTESTGTTETTESTGSAPAADGDTILIAGIAPLTGSLASWGGRRS